MKTSEYPWYSPDFAEYNVAQKAVIPFCATDTNMVVCFSTAVGKTVISECCFGYHIHRKEKVVFVAPYRSLCTEKYEKWKDDIHFSGSGVAIRTGEQSSNESILEDACLTIITCESFDVRTRQKAWKDWISSLSCVVFDEAHIIGDKKRGVVIESALMRITKINPSCRIILLSATMDNALDLAKWLKNLNNKPTKCFVSSWRPNDVKRIEIPVSGWVKMIDKVVELSKQKEGKTIVFVHSKRIGQDIVKRLKKEKIPTAFHNASLSKSKREKIESLFNDPTSGFDILVSTSTLGAGVNIG